MTDKEREIAHLLYELEQELVRHQGEQIQALVVANEGLNRAIASLERSHAILARLTKATGELIGVN
jgi:hypothetical protein